MGPNEMSDNVGTAAEAIDHEMTDADWQRPVSELVVTCKGRSVSPVWIEPKLTRETGPLRDHRKVWWDHGDGSLCNLYFSESGESHRSGRAAHGTIRPRAAERVEEQPSPAGKEVPTKFYDGAVGALLAAQDDIAVATTEPAACPKPWGELVTPKQRTVEVFNNSAHADWNPKYALGRCGDVWFWIALEASTLGEAVGAVDPVMTLHRRPNDHPLPSNIGDRIDAYLDTIDTWIDVRERLPEATKGYWSQQVLVRTADGRTGLDSYYRGSQGHEFWRNDYGEGSTVTHWQPLPLARIARATLPATKGGQGD